MTKRYTPWMALLLALMLAQPLGALTQSDDGITLAPFTSAQYGISGVAPEGWSQPASGVFVRQATPSDPTAIMQQAAPEATAAQLAAFILPRLGLEDLPAREAQREGAALTWDLYTLAVAAQEATLNIGVALAETEQAAYLILLQATPDEYAALHEAVFLPAVDALELLRWNDTDAPTVPSPTQERTVTILTPEVLAVYPHDPLAFTQGLLMHEGLLYESTGRPSTGAYTAALRAVEPATGEVIREVIIPDEHFAEGLALVDDRLVQLTWISGVAFVYDLETFEQVGSFSYEGEGWGLCYDGTYLYMSDGSAVIALRDPETFEIAFRGVVTFDGTPVDRLNELECVGDYLYANVWHTDYILQIDKSNGRTVALIDASELLTPNEVAALGSEDVLNGIAYNPETDTFFITGKRWPQVFEVRFVEAE